MVFFFAFYRTKIIIPSRYICNKEVDSIFFNSFFAFPPRLLLFSIGCISNELYLQSPFSQVSLLTTVYFPVQFSSFLKPTEHRSYLYPLSKPFKCLNSVSQLPGFFLHLSFSFTFQMWIMMLAILTQILFEELGYRLNLEGVMSPCIISSLQFSQGIFLLIHSPMFHRNLFHCKDLFDQ